MKILCISLAVLTATFVFGWVKTKKKKNSEPEVKKPESWLDFMPKTEEIKQRELRGWFSLSPSNKKDKHF